MLRYSSRLLRSSLVATGTALGALPSPGPLWPLLEHTASACSVCAAVIRKAIEETQQQQQQQQQQLLFPEKTWQKSAPSWRQQRHPLLLVQPARRLQQQTPYSGLSLESSSSQPPFPPPSLEDLEADNHAPHWGYNGDHGPEHWASVYPTCSGKSQSPVNIDTASTTYNASLGLLNFLNFDTTDGVAWSLANNGHSAQVTYEAGDLSVSSGGLPSSFKVVQFHFHWGANDSLGSEHTVDGVQYPMEMHVVTYNTVYDKMGRAAKNKDGLAVLGMFFEVGGEDNPGFEGLVDALSKVQDPKTETMLDAVELEKLLPGDTDEFCRYQGSLTTPPCSEVVTWTLFRQPVQISSAQMEVFRTLKSSEVDETTKKNLPLVNNFRPVQPLNGRVVSCNYK